MEEYEYKYDTACEDSCKQDASQNLKSALDFSNQGWRDSVKKWTDLYELDVNMMMTTIKDALVDDKPYYATRSVPEYTLSPTTYASDVGIKGNAVTTATATEQLKNYEDRWINWVAAPLSTTQKSNASIGTVAADCAGGDYAVNVSATLPIDRINTMVSVDSNKVTASSILDTGVYTGAFTPEYSAVIAENFSLKEEVKKLEAQLAFYSTQKTHENFSTDGNFDAVSAWDRAMSGLDKK
mgnify:FL=1